MQEGSGQTADLPDARVIVVPSVRGGVDRGDEEAAGAVVDGGQLVTQGVGSVDHGAVDVELPLVPRPVADPYRPAVAPPRQVGELGLGQVAPTIHGEHDLQVDAALQTPCPLRSRSCPGRVRAVGSSWWRSARCRGIRRLRDGDLLVGDSRDGGLFAVDVPSGVAAGVPVSGRRALTGGDGLVLDHRILSVVRGRADNRVQVCGCARPAARGGPSTADP